MVTRKEQFWTLFFIVILSILLFFLIGNKLQKTTQLMSSQYVEREFSNRSFEVIQEFKQLEQLMNELRERLDTSNAEHSFDIIHRFIETNAIKNNIANLWYCPSESPIYFCFEKNEDVIREEKRDSICSDSLLQCQESIIFEKDSVYYWRMFNSLDSNKGFLLFDISLGSLHEKFANTKIVPSSYVFVVTDDSVIISHPESNYIGHRIAEFEPEKSKVGKNRSKENNVNIVYSGYLSTYVLRKYYPLQLGKSNWGVYVNVPSFVYNDPVELFNRYAIMISSIFIFIVLLCSWYVVKRWQKEKQLQLKVKRYGELMELQQLKNQLNPHFLFNSLNSLRGLIGEDDSLAKEFVVKLAKVYRYILEQKNITYSLIKDEVYIAEQYFFLQKVRFSGAIKLSISQEIFTLENRYIPTLGLQLLIENAIKHNMATIEEPLCINITIDSNNLVVSNTYNLRNETNESSLGIGLQSISHIYLLIGKKNFSCKHIDNQYVCTLPLLTKDEIDLDV